MMDRFHSFRENLGPSCLRIRYPFDELAAAPHKSALPSHSNRTEQSSRKDLIMLPRSKQILVAGVVLISLGAVVVGITTARAVRGDQRARRAEDEALALRTALDDVSAPVAHERRNRRELSEKMEGWIDARATWYGGPDGPGPDGMSIYTGSCGYGTSLVRANTALLSLKGERRGHARPFSLTTFHPTHSSQNNHYISAWHTDGGYDWGLTDKCGQCYEVMCVDGATRGKDWSDLGPWGGCAEPGKKSVVVMISDSCPCHHPNSGNKRWCCGDRTHLDLSYAAFDQIAIRHRGVVDLKVRPAPCDKQGVVAYYE